MDQIQTDTIAGPDIREDISSVEDKPISYEELVRMEGEFSREASSAYKKAKTYFNVTNKDALEIHFFPRNVCQYNGVFLHPIISARVKTVQGNEIMQSLGSNFPVPETEPFTQEEKAQIQALANKNNQYLFHQKEV